MGVWSRIWSRLRLSPGGDAISHFNQGAAYLTGESVGRDLGKAFEEFLIAAKLGDADSQVNVGLMYHGGQGREKNYIAAREWYEKAAAQGHVEAFFNLGVLYSEGHGVRRDTLQSQQWFEKAAELGHAQAQHNLGMLYEDGWLPQIDLAKARKWYKMAADQGHPEGGARLAALESRLYAERCPACHGRVVDDSDAFFRSFKIDFKCKCGGTVYIDGKGVDRLLRLSVLHSGCRSVAYVPPTAWCQTCAQNFVASWESLIIRDHPDEAADVVARAAQFTQRRRRRYSFQLPPDAQHLCPPLIDCRCDDCGNREWWTPDGHGTLKAEDLDHKAAFRCFHCGRWAVFMVE